MNKVALISFIKSYNYEASLQAYALWHIINQCDDVKCDYIDYKRNYKKDFFVWLSRKIYRGIIRLSDEPSYTISEIIKESFLVKKGKVKFSDELNDKFVDFWNMVSYTQKISKSKLFLLNDKYDTFIVGSDQVWNSGKVNIDTTYLLDFVHSNKGRYSYASSIGMKEIPIKYKDKF